MGSTDTKLDEVLVVNLAGRQLTRWSFAEGVLAKLLPVITPCSVCGKDANCPRVIGGNCLRLQEGSEESPRSSKTLDRWRSTPFHEGDLGISDRFIFWVGLYSRWWRDRTD